MKILILYDGAGDFENGLALLSQLNFGEDTLVKVLVAEKSFRTETILIQSMNEIETLLQQSFKNYEFEFLKGRFLSQAIQAANSQEWDLVVYNENNFKIKGFHRGGKLNFIRSRKGETLAKYISKPLLLVRNRISKLDTVLVCTSAEPAAISTLVRTGRILANIKPRMILLHVMSQIALTQPGQEQDLLDSAEPAIERQTREGKYFIMAIRTLRENGFKGEISPKIRHGLVLDEVQVEQRAQHSDLLVIGSHRQAGRSRLVEFLLEDISRNLISESTNSVLVIG